MTQGHFAGCSQDQSCLCELKRYWIVFGLTGATLFTEIVTGIWSGSLALLSDSAHVTIDLFAVIIAIVTEGRVRRDTTSEVQIRAIGGLVSGTALVLGTVYILVETVRRIIAPPELLTGIMMVGAIIGLFGNLGSISILHGSEEDHLTHQSLRLHVLSDAGQSLGVIAAGACILITGWWLVDPITSLGIVLLLARWSYQLISQSLANLNVAE